MFFLVAERLDLILTTILSRCQLTKLTPPTDREIETALTARGIDHAAIPARLADGNLNLALQLAESETASHGERLLEWTRACYRGSPADLTAWTDDFAKLGRETQKHFLRYCLHFWREFLLLSVAGEGGGAPVVRLSETELGSARKLLPLVDNDQLAGITSLLSECAEHVERNANPPDPVPRRGYPDPPTTPPPRRIDPSVGTGRKGVTINCTRYGMYFLRNPRRLR